MRATATYDCDGSVETRKAARRALICTKSPGANARAIQSMAEEEGFEPSYPEG